MVGSTIESVMMDFSESINRDISPPEATFAMSVTGTPLLAENRNVTWSIPSAEGVSDWVNSISKALWGIPKVTKRLNISLRKVGMTFSRVCESSLASFINWS